MNPFSYGNIARGDNFYDRKEETKRIVDILSGGNNVVMFAPRRYGKTSLTYKVMDQLNDKGLVCLYFDFMTIYSLEQLSRIMLKRYTAMQSTIERFVSQASTLLHSIRPSISFDINGSPELGVDFVESSVSVQTVGDVMDMAEKMAADTGRRVIMVFDEFQEVARFEKQGLEAMMRSRIQSHQNVNYMFLGSRTHILADMFLSKNRPFYSSASVVQIDVLPEDDTVAFLQNRFSESSIDISDDCCHYLINTVANIPYYIQLLAAEIWQYMVPNIHLVDKLIIDHCASGIIELKRDYYQELFDKHSVIQKKLLQALCVSGENVFSAEYAKRFRFGATSSIQKAMATLMDEGVVDKNDNKYFISDPFFKMYMIKVVG